MRERWPEFQTRGILVLAVEQGGVEPARRWASRLNLPFPVAVDVDGSVARRLGQEGRRLLGRLPAVLGVDGEGVVRLSHYGAGMADHPSPDALLAALAEAGPQASPIR